MDALNAQNAYRESSLVGVMPKPLRALGSHMGLGAPFMIKIHVVWKYSKTEKT